MTFIPEKELCNTCNGTGTIEVPGKYPKIETPIDKTIDFFNEPLTYTRKQAFIFFASVLTALIFLNYKLDKILEHARL